MSTDLGWLHVSAYAEGADPIDHAIEHVGLYLTMIDKIREGWTQDPNSYPAHHGMTPERWAARIIGELLDAGWTPPDAETLAAAKIENDRINERFARTKHLPCVQCGRSLLAHANIGLDQCSGWTVAPDA